MRCDLCDGRLEAVASGCRWCWQCGLGFNPASYDPAVYDEAYAARYDQQAESPMGARLMAARLRFLGLQVRRGATVLDFGCGVGAFVQAAVRAGYAAFGYEPIPAFRDYQHARGVGEVCASRHILTEHFDAICCFDSLEHVSRPLAILDQLRTENLIITGPVYVGDPEKIENWKHYRPTEHMTYWTARGLDTLVGRLGWQPVRTSDEETQLGRTDIQAVAYRKASDGT